MCNSERVRLGIEEGGVLAVILDDVPLRVIDVAVRPHTQRSDSRWLGVPFNDATIYDSVLT